MSNPQFQLAMRRNPNGYATLTEAERTDLAAALRAEGDERLARTIGVSKYTAVRAAIGLDVQLGSAALVRSWLASPR